MSSIEPTTSVERALRILKCFSMETPEWGISELSRKIKVSKSTVHRLVTSLQKEGFLMQNEVTQQYRLGLNILILSKIILRNMNLRTIAAPIMQELRDNTEETVGLSIIFNYSRLCIEKADSLLGIRRFIEIGEQLPLYTGAAGKLLLAYQDEKFINHVLQETDLKPLTDKTITCPDQISKDLKIIKERGYCISLGEHVPDVNSISAPIWDHNNKVIACINISGPSFRLISEKIEEYRIPLLDAAANISRRMGCHFNSK